MKLKNKYSVLHYQFLFITSLLLSSCAVTPQQVALDTSAPPEQTILCGDALQTSIGIAPIIDKRPAVEHQGDKAHGLYLGVWNQRSGKYVSSDKDFKGDIATILTQSLADYIEKSNCFRDVKVLKSPVKTQMNETDLLALSTQTDARYVLVSELNHFFGEQSQNANLFVVPAIYVNAAGYSNNVGQAIGQTEMLLTLYDLKAGHEVWREKAAGVGQSTIEGAFPQAARDSFTKACQDATQKLYQFSKDLTE